MRNLLRIFHFHDGKPTHRAVKIVASFTAALLLATASTATLTTATGTDSDGLRILGNPCTRMRLDAAGTLVAMWETSIETEENHISYGTRTATGRTIPATSGRTHAAIVSGLDPIEIYQARVHSRQSETGVTVQSGICTVALDTPNGAPPRIADAAILDRTDTSAVVTFTTTTPTRSWVSIHDTAGDRSPFVMLTPVSDLRTEHAISVHDLKPARSYIARIDAMDTAGNTAFAPVDLTFTTLRDGATDRDPPILGPIRCTAGSSTIEVAFSVSEPAASGFIEYGLGAIGNRLEAAATITDDRTDLVRTLIDLVPNTVYTIRALGIDAAGNVTVSDPETCRTLPHASGGPYGVPYVPGVAREHGPAETLDRVAHSTGP